MVDANIHPSKLHDISLFGLRLAIGAIFIAVGNVHPKLKSMADLVTKEEYFDGAITAFKTFEKHLKLKN